MSDAKEKSVPENDKDTFTFQLNIRKANVAGNHITNIRINHAK